jgi:hypothetical protein
VALCDLGCTLPSYYVNGTRVQWRRFAVRGLDHTPDVGGVMALYGLGCVLLSDYINGCRGVISLRVAFC